MAHPFNEHRQHKVEHSRVAHITKGYASGGGVSHSDEKQDRKLFKKLMAEEDSQAVEGGSAKERMDRPGRAGKKDGGTVLNRARGGRTKHKGHTTVNILNTGGGHPGMTPGGPPPGLGAAPPMMPPRPPMASPAMPPGAPGMAPPGGAPMMPPPGMPPRRSGGRAYAKGGAVKSGPAFEEGKRAGTPVQNNPSGKNDQRDVGRGKPVTYKTGGKVEAPQGVSAPHLPGGSGGGEARLAKERMAKRSVSGMVP